MFCEDYHLTISGHWGNLSGASSVGQCQKMRSGEKAVNSYPLPKVFRWNSCLTAKGLIYGATNPGAPKIIFEARI